MYIERVSYKRTYNLGNFSSEVIGVEFVLNKDESEAIALQRAKEIVEETHKRNYPNLVVSNEPIVEQVLSKEQITENTIAEINKCTSIQELETFEKFAKKHSQETWNAYGHKFKTFVK